METKPIQEENRVVFLDGIRGWASLMVLLSHLLVFFLANNVPGLKGWFFGFASDGNLAVFIFFVLSGFALSTGYLTTGRLDVLTSQALRRYLRLALPILFSSLMLLVVWKSGFLFNQSAGMMSGNAWTTKFYQFETGFLGCLKFALYDVFFRYDGATSYNPALWTMAIELWGSFVVFSICALVMQLRTRLLVLGVCIAYLVVVNNIWYLPFVCGLAIALLHRRYGLLPGRLSNIAALLIAAFVVYYSASTMRGGLFGLPAMPRGDLLNIAAACGVVVLAACNPLARRFFENRVSRYLGKISFSLYLTHFLVLCSFSSYLMLQIDGLGIKGETASAINFAASLLVCLLVAQAFCYVENFSIRTARRFSDWMMGKSRPAEIDATPDTAAAYAKATT